MMRDAKHKRLGIGIGWRPELAAWIHRRSDLGFVEIIAENLQHATEFHDALHALRDRGVEVIPHGISLSLGGSDRPDRRRLRALAQLARRFHAPLVSEHIAFVRAGGVEAGHLLPVPRTRAAIEVLVENIRIAQDALPVPLALENIATLVEWPAEMDEADFLNEILDRTGTGLLLDVSNVCANVRNHGGCGADLVDRLALERLAYVHLAGGVDRDGLFHDTHAHPITVESLELLSELARRESIPGAMLERDDRFPAAAELDGELRRIAAALIPRRELRHAGR